MKKIIVLLCILTALVFYFISCTDNSIKEGRQLAKTYCQSCHKLPEPGLLDKKTWANYVLPKMGNFLGFGHFDFGSYYESGKGPEVMQLTDWNKIVSYYVREAPDSLEKPEGKQKIQMGLKNFDEVIPPFSVKDPATTYVSILPEQQLITFADGATHQLYRLRPDGNIVDSFKVGEGVVNVRFTPNDFRSLAMGILYPSDEKKGSLQVQNIQTKKVYVLLDSLQRPVYADYADLNNDTLQDIVICEFGNLNGQLSWFENKGDNKYLKHILRPLPGAVRTQVVDMNGDGKPDIVALMAQGDEGIFIYFNKGNGQFEEKRVLQLPPSYGSNYFELDDFNKDGHPDILATNGDNGDYPPVLKPYHGIRIYMNDGHNNFEEKVFLPVNGAIKAMARDFDGDGDLDIASISYFPDYDHEPEESFIYWENKGDLSYHPFSFKDAYAGRWLTMDVADIDKDGDTDIIIGNAKFPLGRIPDWLMKRWNSYSPSFIILKNRKVNSQ